MSGKHDLARDFLASIVVFLVALPLCLGIALASGAPPLAGLITGMVGGILVGWLAGSPLQVSGPAAGLVAIVYEVIVEYGMPGLGIIVAAAGLLQLAAGWLRMGGWFRAISPAVIQGMLAGIGVLIVLSQFHVLLDVKPESSGIDNLLSIPSTIIKGLFPIEDSSHHWAAMVGVTSLAALLAWNFVPGRFKLIPPALVAVLAGEVMAGVLHLPVNLVSLPGQLTDAITLPNMQSLSLLTQADVWVMVATIAIVASAETMLSAGAVDKMHKGPRTDYDREMVAQGVGNTVCGLLGALPMTGVIVRSSANINAGATSRVSTILHGVWLLLLVTCFPFVLEKIPTASLAAILVYTGYKLVRPDAIRTLWHQGGNWEVAVYGVTLVMVVATNLLEGVIAGTVVALLRLVYVLSRLQGYTIAEEGNRLQLYLRGSATFLSLPRLVSILDKQPPGQELHIHVEHLDFIDHACLEHLRTWESFYALSGGSVIVEWHTLAQKLNGNKPIAQPVEAELVT